MDRHRLTDVGPTAISCGYADSGMPLSVHCRSIFRMYYITLGCVSKNLQDLGLYMLAVNLYLLQNYGIYHSWPYCWSAE